MDIKLGIQFIVSYVLTVLILRILWVGASRSALIDPRNWRSYGIIVPLVGGAGIGLSYLITSQIWGSMQSKSMYLIALIPLTLGILDDIYDLSVRIRLLFQGLTAVLMIAVGTKIAVLGNIWGTETVALSFLSWPVTFICILGVMNAINMSDGIDGLAGTYSLVALSALCILCSLALNNIEAQDIFNFVPALFAFLCLNLSIFPFKNMKAYLGNSGSLFLGCILAWYFIRLSQPPHAIMDPITALWLFALPLIDMIHIIIHRLSRGRSPFEGDRDHFHHWLQGFGLSHTQVVTCLGCLSTLCATFGVWGYLHKISETLMLLLLLSLIVTYMVLRSQKLAQILGVVALNKYDAS